MEEKEGKERDSVNKTGWRKGKHTALTTTDLSPKLQQVSFTSRNFPLIKAKGTFNPIQPSCVLITAGLTAAGSLQQSHLDSQFNLQKRFTQLKTMLTFWKAFF